MPDREHNQAASNPVAAQKSHYAMTGLPMVERDIVVFHSSPPANQIVAARLKNYWK
jgi:hypothetical protein